MPKRERSDSEQIYLRQLPGGGFVAIDVSPVRTLLGQRKYRGEVVVERRAERYRREGHPAPVVASAEGPSIASVFYKLFPVAQSNTAVATHCLAKQRLAAHGR